MAIVRVTLDTNAIISTWNEEAQTAACQAIVALAKHGRIHLGVASPDFDDDRGLVVRWVVRGKLEGWLTEIPAIRRREYWNEAAPPAIDGDPRLEDAIIRCLHPGNQRPWEQFGRNQQLDVDHLLSHRMSARDVFVTGDRGILRKAERLRKLAISVMAPEDFVATFDDRSANQEQN